MLVTLTWRQSGSVQHCVSPCIQSWPERERANFLQFMGSIPCFAERQYRATVKNLYSTESDCLCLKSGSAMKLLKSCLTTPYPSHQKMVTWIVLTSVQFKLLPQFKPGLPVHHKLPEFTQTHVHQVGDTIQSSHPLSSPSPSAFNLSQHHGRSKWVSSWHQVSKVLEFQLQHQSFQWIFRTDFL